MATANNEGSSAAPVRNATQQTIASSTLSRAVVRTTTASECEDCRAMTAFHAWHDVVLAASFNTSISFADWKIIPKGKRAVIELVTAQVLVPTNEWARLRMYTSLGTVPSNIDLFLTFQGNVSGKSVYDATHAVRIYSDNEIEFNIKDRKSVM